MIAKDKQLHAAVGAVLGLSAFVLNWYALVPVFVAGIGKEVYDKVSKKGTPDIYDTVWTCGIGSLVVVVINLIKG